MNRKKLYHDKYLNVRDDLRFIVIDIYYDRDRQINMARIRKENKDEKIMAVKKIKKDNNICPLPEY